MPSRWRDYYLHDFINRLRCVMKKKLLLGLSAALIILAGTIVTALYKADDILAAYKPQIEGILSSTLGAQVKLEGLTLSIFPRPKVAVSKLNIRDLQGKESGVSVGSLEAQAALWPLLSKKLEISTVTIIRPVVALQKTPAGISVRGIAPRASDTKPPQPNATPSAPTSAATSTQLGVSIERIVVHDGELEVEDTTNRTVHSLKRIELDMGVELSGEQLRIPQGTLALVAQGIIPISMTVADATFNKASGATRLPECRVTFPPGVIKLAGTTSSSKAGSISVSAESLDLAKVVQLAAAFSPAAANVKPTGQLSILLDHDIGKGVTTVKTATLKGFGGTLSAPTTLTLGSPIKAATQLNVTGLSIRELLQAFSPHLAGTIDGTITQVRSKLSEIAINDPANTATGNGSLQITSGVIKGLNIPGQALAKIDSLPFISGNLRQRVPPEFESLFSKPDMVVKELASNFSISRGMIQLSDFNLMSDYFSVRGGGTYSLLGEANLKTDLILSPTVSAGIVKKVKELEPLIDSQGHLVLPLSINGKVPAVIATPDLNAILKKASAAGVAQALDRVLKDKKVGGKIGKILGF